MYTSVLMNREAFKFLYERQSDYLLVKCWGKSLQNLFSSVLSGPAVIEGITTDTIQNDFEVARRLLRQTQEQFEKLELKVSRLKYHQLVLETKL